MLKTHNVCLLPFLIHLGSLQPNLQAGTGATNMELDKLRNLKGLREEAGLSQAELANQLGIQQAQVSRYESNPESISFNLAIKWIEICGKVSNSHHLNINTIPRERLLQELHLSLGFIDGAPRISHPDISASLGLLREALVRLGRKPVVGVYGAFDAGKSTLLNSLLGKDTLTTSYQPTTSLACLIRSIKDKPNWQSENVWVMDKNFDPSRSTNEAYCRAHLLLAGSYGSLKDYTTHDGSEASKISENAGIVLVYVDSPILDVADFLDTPGFGNSGSDDDANAKNSIRIVDAMIYISTVDGFMRNEDVANISGLLKEVPPVEGQPFSNLFIVATKSHTVPENELNSIIQKASARTYKTLRSALDNRYIGYEKSSDSNGETSVNRITSMDIEDQFRARFFTFSVEAVSLSVNFENTLSDFLCDTQPDCSKTQYEAILKAAKETLTGDSLKWISALERTRDDIENVRAEAARMKADLPTRLQSFRDKETKGRGLIDSYKATGRIKVQEIYSTVTAVDAIEKLIERSFNDKKEAQKLAVTMVQSELVERVEVSIKKSSRDFSQQVDEMLKDFAYELNLSLGVDCGSRLFNIQAAFAGALGGVGALGALAAWSTIAAAGSNLGGYILVAQVAGWLGISSLVGGSGTVMAAVSALGGPITIAIAGAVLAGFAVASLFGPSWQRRLAKAIEKALRNANVESRLVQGSDDYWDQTKTAFCAAMQKTAKNYEEKVKEKEKEAFTTSPEQIKNLIDQAKESLGFFKSMPLGWAKT